MVAESQQLVSLPEAAEFLGVTARTIEKLVARGVIRRVKLPGIRRTLLLREDLERLISENQEMETGPSPDNSDPPN